MLFNSFTFGVFLIVVFALYWFVFKNKVRSQNFLLLISSYVFYGWWDYRFLSLIFISSVVDYYLSHQIAEASSPQKRKTYLIVSLVTNLGLLGFCKYYNFFIESLVNSFSLAGVSLEISTLNIILPVGISFYTFQTLSYTVDIYRKRFEPANDLVSFLAFVSFFPQLVAGPIERASNLLPQFSRPRFFTYEDGKEGARLILWGLFKKVVIADQCAIFVDQLFDNPSGHSGSALSLGAIFFSIQVYGDFSGYSDIAMGTARLFGFELMRNFRYPFFSRDIAEFWRRWHISLSTWFKDYLYIPLGGSRGSTFMKVRNVMIVFIVSGLWHGAQWTFVIWGFLHGLYYIPQLLSRTNRQYLNDLPAGRFFPETREFFKIAITFTLVTFAFIFFRANSLNNAFDYIRHMFSSTLVEKPPLNMIVMLAAILLFVAVEWINRDRLHPFQMDQKPFALRYATYGIISFLIIGFSGNANSFIYFQF